MGRRFTYIVKHSAKAGCGVSAGASAKAGDPPYFFGPTASLITASCSIL
jgi:hypothetical protein